MVEIVSDALLVAGGALMALAGLGVVRFGDLWARMHAATKAGTLGFVLIAAGAAIALPETASKLIASVVLLFVTAPAAAHLIARVAHDDGIEIDLDGPDDLAAGRRSD